MVEAIDLPVHTALWVDHVFHMVLRNYKGLGISLAVSAFLIWLAPIVVAFAFLLSHVAWLVFIIVNLIITAIDVDIVIIDAIIEVCKSLGLHTSKPTPPINLVTYDQIKQGLQEIENCSNINYNPFLHLRDLIRLLIGTPTCAIMRYTYSTFGFMEPAVENLYHGSANPEIQYSNNVNNCAQQFEAYSLNDVGWQKITCIIVGVGFVLVALWIIFLGILITCNKPFVRVVVDILGLSYNFVRDFGVVTGKALKIIKSE